MLHTAGEDPLELGRTDNRDQAVWLATTLCHLHLTDARVEVHGVTYADATADMVTLDVATDVLTDALGRTAALAVVTLARQTYPTAAYVVLEPRSNHPGHLVLDILDDSGDTLITNKVESWPGEADADDHAAYLVDGGSWRDFLKAPDTIKADAGASPVLSVAAALDSPPTTPVAAAINEAWVHLQVRSALADQFPLDDASPADQADAAEQNATAAQLLQRLVDALLPH